MKALWENTVVAPFAVVVEAAIAFLRNKARIFPGQQHPDRRGKAVRAITNSLGST